MPSDWWTERSVIDWKTTGARYPDQPEGLLALATISQEQQNRFGQLVEDTIRRI